jgi:carbonic anhydrase/acetyltransferase-like protein (isoleucine patch superfamily)
VFSFEFEGKRPVIHPEAWIAPTATLVGDVRIGRWASVWYGAVLRGDVGPIVVGEGSNVQDNSILHVMTGDRLDIGSFSSIAHGCIIHGRSIGHGSLIGNGATLLDGSVIGSGCFIAAGSLVTPGTQVPDGTLALGAPARVTGPIKADSPAADILQRNADSYRRLMSRHRAGIRPVNGGSM